MYGGYNGNKKKRKHYCFLFCGPVPTHGSECWQAMLRQQRDPQSIFQWIVQFFFCWDFSVFLKIHCLSSAWLFARPNNFPRPVWHRGRDVSGVMTFNSLRQIICLPDIVLLRSLRIRFYKFLREAGIKKYPAIRRAKFSSDEIIFRNFTRPQAQVKKE